MEKLPSEPLEVNGSSYELSIYTFTCDTSKSSIERDSATHRVLCVCKMRNERNKCPRSYSI